MADLCKKSRLLTGYLELVLEEYLDSRGKIRDDTPASAAPEPDAKQGWGEVLWYLYLSTLKYSSCCTCTCT